MARKNLSVHVRSYESDLLLETGFAGARGATGLFFRQPITHPTKTFFCPVLSRACRPTDRVLFALAAPRGRYLLRAFRNALHSHEKHVVFVFFFFRRRPVTTARDVRPPRKGRTANGTIGYCYHFFFFLFFFFCRTKCIKYRDAQSVCSNISYTVYYRRSSSPE